MNSTHYRKRCVHLLICLYPEKYKATYPIDTGLLRYLTQSLKLFILTSDKTESLCSAGHLKQRLINTQEFSLPI